MPTQPVKLSRPEADHLQRESTDFKAWVHKVRQKFYFSIDKTALQGKIGRLDDQNRNLLALSRQMGQFKDFRSISEHEQNSSLVKKGLDEVCQIRKASLELCSALNTLWLCQEHSEHSANLRLGLDLGDSTSIPASKIHFDVMVTNWAIDSCDGVKKPVELFIESSLELISGRENQASTVAGHSRSHLVELIGESYNKASGQVDPIDLDPQGLQGSSIPSQPGEPLQLTNLCTGPTNLCKHIHKKPEAGNASTCLGYLSGFVVYRNPPENHNFSGAIPMARLFSRKHGNHKMNPLDKWRLGGALSRAVLQYHSTPWLRETWMDKNILFFEKKSAEDSGLLKSPHLHLFRQINDDTNKTLSEIYDDRSIKNKTLFQLGTILLELEFEDSLESIVERWNTTLPRTEHVTGSLTDRLLVPKRHAGENLGVKYGKIVRMCLDCDFGLGLSDYSLNDKALQKAFYLQTVCQFEKLLPSFEKIYGVTTS